MGEQGGSIIYNKDNVIPPGKTEGNNKINAVNVHKTGAAFNEIYGVTDSTAAGLTVQNTKTFSGDKTSTISLTPELEQEIDNNTELTAAEKTSYKQDIRNGKMKYTAITDVEVDGKISNFYGNVTISNASGDIIISGGTQARPTGVFGNTVKLIAANGSIAQNYKEGIVNINGDPEKYLAGSATAMKDALGLSATDEDSKSKEEDYTRTDSSQEATGYIAGRDVYVSAANVNVNGLIQSGYKTYAATVTEEQLAAAKQRPASRAAVIQNHTMYKVNDGGAKWNSTDKAFDYVPQVYWDPATNKLVVEDIDTAGGKVYLTGKIASTGDGRILAADGAAEISVINQTNLDMNVGNVLNNQREGVITIADTANDTWTEYKRGQTRTITGYADYLKKHSDDTDIYADATQTANNLSVGNTISYGVKGGQLYTWVNGYSVDTTRTYEHYERRGMWGLVQTADETELKGCAGGYCGHNEGGHIWGFDTHTWKEENDGKIINGKLDKRLGSYTGRQSECKADRIRSVYGYEYAGGFTGLMESADTASTGSIGLLDGVLPKNGIQITNILNALEFVYPTQRNTAVYGPLRNLDVYTWNSWIDYVGKYGGYGYELAFSGKISLKDEDDNDKTPEQLQEELDEKLKNYVYGYNVVAGRSEYVNFIRSGGDAGGYVGMMLLCVLAYSLILLFSIFFQTAVLLRYGDIFQRKEQK